jgi:hypothetical protein
LVYNDIGISCSDVCLASRYIFFLSFFSFNFWFVSYDYCGLAAAIEKDLWATGTVNEEYLKALNALFSNFPRLRATEPATLSIPHLVTSLKTGSEATQEAALDALFLLRQAWSACPAEVSRAQSIAAADAIPLLQYLIQSGPPRFQEKAEFLLQCLPGTLVVIIKRGNNMKQSVGNPSVFCKLTLGNTPPRQTQVKCFYIIPCCDFLISIFFSLGTIFSCIRKSFIWYKYKITII